MEEKKDRLKEEEKPEDRFKAYQGLFYIFLGVLFLIAVWELIWLGGGQVFPEFFASVGYMFQAMGRPETWLNLGYSFLRILISLAIVIILGYLCGLLSAFFSPLEKIFQPFIYFMTSFPTASLIFVLMIYTKITCYILVAILTFPIVYKAVLGGGKLVIAKYEDQLAIEGRYKPKTLWKIVAPLSLPYLYIGFAQASGLALKAEIMGEVFMASSEFKGIGVLINRAAKVDFEYDKLFGLTLLALLTMAVFDLLIWILKRKLKAKYGTEPVNPYHW
jgi:NitT/TauT family transport system permease protein